MVKSTMDTRFKRRRNLNITFTSVSVVRSLYLTIFLSTCFLTCLFLWMSNYDDETNGLMISQIEGGQSQGQGHWSTRMMMNKGPMFSVTPLNSKKNQNWITEGGSEGTSAGAADFVTDFDVSIDETEVDLDIDITTIKDSSRNRPENGNGNRKSTAVTEFIPKAKSEAEIKIVDLQVDGGDSETSARMQQIADHYDERLNLLESYCKSNPVFKIGRHHLTMETLHLLNGKTNMWIRSASKFQLPPENSSKINPDRRVILEWCPVFKAASTPWMAVLMKLKNHLFPRTEEMIKSGKLTFVKLASMFHMKIERPTHTSSYLTSSSKFKTLSESPSSSSNSSSVLNISMLIVRHPFERLLSAYKDKLERVQGRFYYHRKYGIPIVQKYRYQKAPSSRMHRRSADFEATTSKIQNPDLKSSPTSVIEAMRKDLNSNFQDWKNSFAVPLLTMRMNENENDLVKGHQIRDEDDGFSTDLDLDLDRSSYFNNRFQRVKVKGSMGLDFVPTFNEFVQYLLNLSPMAMDEHWRPIFLDCNACNGPRHPSDGSPTIPFNLILKVETMDQDRDFLLNLLGLNATFKTELDLVWKRWANPSGIIINNAKKDLRVGNEGHRMKDSHSSSSHMKYFSQITKQDLKALYLIYEPDFQMFGYSATEYIAMGK